MSLSEEPGIHGAVYIAIITWDGDIQLVDYCRQNHSLRNWVIPLSHVCDQVKKLEENWLLDRGESFFAHKKF